MSDFGWHLGVSLARWEPSCLEDSCSCSTFLPRASTTAALLPRRSSDLVMQDWTRHRDLHGMRSMPPVEELVGGSDAQNL